MLKIDDIIADLTNNDVFTRITINECLRKYFSLI